MDALPVRDSACLSDHVRKLLGVCLCQLLSGEDKLAA